MPTTPRGVWTPDDSDDWDLTTDLAAMAVSIDTAITTVANLIPLQTRFVGTEADRAALAAPNLRNGISFQTTDSNLVWLRQSGAWRIASGTVLASATSVTTATGTNALIASVISTVALPVGQRVKVTASMSTVASGTNAISQVNLNVRNNAADVTAAAYDAQRVGRGLTASGGNVSARTTISFLYTTTVAAKVSAAAYVGNAITSVYGPDGIDIWIEAA